MAPELEPRSRKVLIGVIVGVIALVLLYVAVMLWPTPSERAAWELESKARAAKEEREKEQASRKVASAQQNDDAAKQYERALRELANGPPRFQPVTPGKPASLYVALDMQEGVLCRVWNWEAKDLPSTAILRNMEDLSLCRTWAVLTAEDAKANNARYQPLVPDSPMALHVALDTHTGTLCRSWEWEAKGGQADDIWHKLQLTPLCGEERDMKNPPPAVNPDAEKYLDDLIGKHMTKQPASNKP